MIEYCSHLPNDTKERTTVHIIAQIAGIAGAGLNIFSYQMKENRRLYLFKGIGGVLFALQFFLLGNLTAALLNLVSLMRAAALVSPRFRSNRWVFLVIQLMYIACCVFTFGKGDVVFGGAAMAMALSVVTTLMQLLETGVLLTRNGKIIRLAQVCVISPAWLINNFLTGSIGGVVTEVFGISSVILSFLRYGLNGFETETDKK